MAMPNQDALFNKLQPKRPDGIAGPDMGGMDAPPMLAPEGADPIALNPPSTNMRTMDGPAPSAGIVDATPSAPSPPPMAAGPMPAAGPAPLVGQFGGKMGGFDMGKLNDPGRMNEKTQMGRVMSQFDPRGGVTPEMLAALNQLGIAEFSGQGDKLTVNNTKNDPRFGTGGTADIVKGLKGNNEDTAWQPWFVDDGAAAGGGGMSPAAGGATPPMVGGNIDPLLSGDPMQKILAALGQHGSGRSNAEALFSKLGA